MNETRTTRREIDRGNTHVVMAHLAKPVLVYPASETLRLPVGAFAVDESKTQAREGGKAEQQAGGGRESEGAHRVYKKLFGFSFSFHRPVLAGFHCF
jgi:hypothetical protein